MPAAIPLLAEPSPDGPIVCGVTIYGCARFGRRTRLPDHREGGPTNLAPNVVAFNAFTLARPHGHRINSRGAPVAADSLACAGAGVRDAVRTASHRALSSLAIADHPRPVRADAVDPRCVQAGESA